MQHEQHGDGTPHHGPQPAAAQAELQPGGDVQEVLVAPCPGLGPAVAVGRVLAVPLSRQLVVVKVEPGRILLKFREVSLTALLPTWCGSRCP